MFKTPTSLYEKGKTISWGGKRKRRREHAGEQCFDGAEIEVPSVLTMSAVDMRHARPSAYLEDLTEKFDDFTDGIERRIVEAPK